MSLLRVHIAMVVTAIVFSVGFAARGLVVAAGTGSAPAALLAGFSALAALLLAFHLSWLIRNKARRIRAGSSRAARRDS